MSRAINKRQPKITVAFMVEGNTEMWYLSEVKGSEAFESVMTWKILNPFNCDKKIKDSWELLKREKRNYDRIFWILDLDVIINNTKSKNFLKNCIKNSCDSNITIVLNSPCFEYWILLHYKDTNKCFSSYKELLKDLKSNPDFKDYEKSEKYYRGLYNRLKEHLLIAYERAIKYYPTEIDDNAGYSGMYKIFDISINDSEKLIDKIK